jgi:hypothetical protein
MKSTAPPTKTFSDIFVDYDTSPLGRLNATYQRLARDITVHGRICTALSEMGQHHFVNLVTNPDQARIAFSLYAGDGTVTKITAADYVPREKLPLVLFPFQERLIHGNDMAGDFIIQRFPAGIVNANLESNVPYMKSKLSEVGLGFIDQEDRACNIAGLADGNLAIIDGDSVRVKDINNKVQLAKDVAAWEKRIITMYPDLYGPNASPPRQTAQTDYHVTHYRAKQQPAVPRPVAVQAKTSWFMGLFRPSAD